MNTARIAFRNMSRQKKRSILLVAAIAFGVLVVTLVNGFSAGMLRNVKDNLSHMIGGHLFVNGAEVTASGRLVSVIRDESVALAAIAESGIEPIAITRRTSTFATLLFGANDTLQQIEGVDWAAEEETLRGLTLESGTVDGTEAENTIVLPASAAEKLDVRVGDTVLARITTVTGQQNVGEFLVAATWKSDSLFGFSAAYARIGFINDLLGIPEGQFQSMSMYFEDMSVMNQAGDALHESMATRAKVDPRLDVTSPMDMAAGAAGGEGRDRRAAGMMSGGMGGAFGAGGVTDERWQGTKYSLYTLDDVISPLSQVVGVLNTVSLVVFVILLVIIMVGILNTFRMITIERTREIGTMRSIGMQRAGVRNIFLLEALFVALAGALAGLLIAGIVSIAVSLIPLDAAGFLSMFLRNSRLSIVLQPAQILSSTLIIAVLSLAAAFFPARKASRMDPAVALRTQY